MVIHLLKDGLFVLNRFTELEIILKQILKNDANNIEVNTADVFDCFKNLDREYIPIAEKR